MYKQKLYFFIKTFLIANLNKYDMTSTYCTNMQLQETAKNKMTAIESYKLLSNDQFVWCDTAGQIKVFGI